MKATKQVYVDVTAIPHVERQNIFITNKQIGFEKFIKINNTDAKKVTTFYVFCYRKD